MRTLIVYESMYGRTHTVADAIAKGLGPDAEVKVVPVGEASDELVSWADLLVVGGPTHVHGMTRATTRRSAQDAAAKPDSVLELDPAADGPGLREWFQTLGQREGMRAAAFDTRISGPAFLSGRASAGIASSLRRHGCTIVIESESFLVDRQTNLLTGEAERAEHWGAMLAGLLVPA
jgi:Flavodoxin